MRIAHVSFSSSGGAGGVAESLASSQSELGHDSKLFNLTNSALRIADAIRQPITLGSTAIDNFLVRNRDFNAFISLARREVSSDTPKHLSNWRPDLIHFHWLPGTMRIQEAQKLCSLFPCVVTLHDMAFFTGGCHYSLGCSGYQSGCEGCPAVRPNFRKLVSQMHSKTLALTHSAAAVTAPSRWLMNMYKSTHPPAHQITRVIGNPVSMQAFQKDLRSSMSGNRFCIVAASLEDPIKRVKESVMALSKRQDCEEIILIGKGGASLAKLDQRVRVLGELDKRELLRILRSCSYLISSSIQEAFGMTIVEAAMVGVPALIVQGSGSEELTRNSGHLLVESTAALATKEIPNPSSHEYRSLCRAVRAHAEEFRIEGIATAYLRLYSEAVQT